VLSGIGGGTPYLLEKATVRIGPIKLVCRIAWAQKEDVPILLGRTDVLDQLVVKFDGPRRTVFFHR
jgi:hypothetical protein